MYRPIHVCWPDMIRAITVTQIEAIHGLTHGFQLTVVLYIEKMLSKYSTRYNKICLWPHYFGRTARVHPPSPSKQKTIV